MSVNGFTTPYSTAPDRAPSVPDLPPRLHGRYAAYFRTAQNIALIALYALCGGVFSYTVFPWPVLTLWPEASHGSPQHWAAGIALGAVLIATLTNGIAAIDQDQSLTRDFTHATDVQRWNLQHAKDALALRCFVTELALAALFVFPIRARLLDVWAANDWAEVERYAPALLWHVAPLIALVALRVVTDHALRIVANELEARQRRGKPA